jgi:hypothetical protein
MLAAIVAEASMPTSTMTALAKRRAKLVMQATSLEATLIHLRADIADVDAAIRVHEAERQKPRVPRAQRVDAVRIALDMLRQAKQPLTTREILHGVLLSQGKDPTDRETVRVMLERVRLLLIRQRNAGVLRSTEGERTALLWEVAR